MNKYLHVLLLCLLGCTHIIDTTGDRISFMYFKADNTEYSCRECRAIDVFYYPYNKIYYAELYGRSFYNYSHDSIRYGIDMMFDTIATGTYPIDSGFAVFLDTSSYHRSYFSFGSADDSISIAVDSADDKVTGYFQFRAANGLDTVFINSGVFISYTYQ
jgi:hypothetical protein